MEEFMDRRQKKTREAIFAAFIELLAQKNVSQITVGQIIQQADVGRATFYAHFETKEYLIKALCEELFCHIFDAAGKEPSDHHHIFHCEAPESVFCHLLQHLQKNDNHILELLAGQNNELFLGYFKSSLLKLVENRLEEFQTEASKELPRDFWVHHIAASFVQTVRWWLNTGMTQTPETMDRYFHLAVLGFTETGN